MTERKAWYLGNTTVRNPRRLRDGLRILAASPLHGNLVGHLNEQAFAQLLDAQGIVDVARLSTNPTADASDLGRKWRSALVQLGFLTPGPRVLEGVSKNDSPFVVTPNGRRLIEAQSLPEEQECFLRALLAQQLPSPVEPFPGPTFNPLRTVLEVLVGLKQESLEPAITWDEMASIVQLARGTSDVAWALEELQQYRQALALSTDRRMTVDQRLTHAAAMLGGQSASTLKDYADSNFRYLKLSGLFTEDGRRLRVAAYRQRLVSQILAEPFEPLPPSSYLNRLWSGAHLPSDETQRAVETIRDTVALLEAEGRKVILDEGWADGEPAALSQLRLRLEDEWLKVQEERYAERQSVAWSDIIKYLRALTNAKKDRLIPQGEAPAYLEWTLWRAFLAIDSLVNKPWEARRFRIDQDMLPVAPAPGNGPDMIFEFEEFVLVLEATLTTSSRQEAAEGEPVRRHVATVVDKYRSSGKRVYGLFAANHINTNTAETFRIGVWYRDDDSKMALRIVPLTLEQLVALFEVTSTAPREAQPQIIEDLIMKCLAHSNADAPDWKHRIDDEVARSVRTLSERKGHS